MATVDVGRVDLLALIGRDTRLKRVASTNGGEYAGPCPFCGGEDRFRVWPDHQQGRGRFWCRQCGASGDAIAYLRKRDGLTFAEACDRLGVASASGARRASAVKPRFEVDFGVWQARARAFVAEAEAALWDGRHPEALAWLRKRGLGDAVIREARLGLNVAERHEAGAAWGMPGVRAVWLPRGIVIPWEIGGELWRVNVRRPAGDLAHGGPKYVCARGSRNGLYGADRLCANLPALVVEGEIDALAVYQHAGDLVAAVATGSVSGARDAAWVARLALPQVVLLSFDADDAGEAAAAWWLGVLANAKRWRPYWGKDAAEFAQSGADVRAWVLAALPGAEPLECCAICGGELYAYGACGWALCTRCAERCAGLWKPSPVLECAAGRACGILPAGEVAA